MSDNTREYVAANPPAKDRINELRAARGEALIGEPAKRVDNPADGNMTPEREAHLLHIEQQVHVMLDTKYRKGQAEHGGSLFDVPTIQLVDNAIEEAIDQLTYLLTIREKLVGR